MNSHAPVLRQFVKRHVDLPTLSVAIAAAAMVWPAVVGAGVVFWGVPLLQFYPWRLFAREVLAQGHLPLWNPLVGMGAPLLANAQSALLYPPNWLLLFLPLDLGQGWLMLAHWIWAGAGSARLCRRLGIGPLGQTIAALAFSLSGYSVARAGFFSINAALAWVPWVVLAGDRLAARASRRSVLWLGLAVAFQILAGHWQTCWYTWLFLAGWLTSRALGQAPRARNLVRVWVALLGATALAFAVAAAQVLPTLEYLAASQRATGVNSTLAFTYSFWPWRLLGFVAPDLFGNPAQGNYWGYANFWEDAIYVGLLPFLLSLGALLSYFRRRTAVKARLPRVPFGYLSLILPLAFVLALGSNTPVFPFLYRWVPTFDLFQAPTRIMLLVVFSLALLAGAGAEMWDRPEGATRRWASRGLVATMAIALGAAAAALFLPIRATFVTATMRTGVTAVLAILLWLFARRASGAARDHAIWATLVVLLVGADLALAGWGLNPLTGRDLYRAEPNAAAELADKLDGHRLYVPAQDENQLMFKQFFRFDTFRAVSDWLSVRDAGLPNVALIDGLNSANNFDPLLPGRYSSLLEAVERLPAGSQDRLWALMDIRYLVRISPSGAGTVLEPVRSEAQRAWGVCAAQWSRSGEESLSLLLAPGFDPAREVVLEVGAGEEGSACAQAPRVTIVDGPDPGRVVLEASFAQPGFLVLADTDYPGWQAQLDGAWTPLLRADYNFRAVRVPTGTHLIEFVYRPVSFWAGAALSGIAVLALLAALLLSVPRRASPEPTPP